MSKAHSVERPRVLFRSSYGVLPRFLWWAVVPLLLLASGVLLVRAVWFGEGVPLGAFRVPPGVVAYAVSPVLWGLCGLLVALEAYRRRNPQEVLVTTAEVTLPRGRFTAATISIAWDDLEATLQTANLLGWHMYEVTCTALSSGESVRISSALFRTMEDFAAFLQIMAEHMGQEWSVARFRPGTSRGGPGDRRRRPPRPRG